MLINSAKFRFYEELNDFLSKDKKKVDFYYEFHGHPSIKDAIEAIGVPHTEVELILANGKSVGFDYLLRNGDRFAVYPVFESFDISPIVKLRNKVLREVCFILDVHLGKLAKTLRMLGFDALYRNDYKDEEIIDISVNERRIILTRDRIILKNKLVTHGYYMRSTDPIEQAREVLKRFDLFSMVCPFKRCIQCNGILKKIDKREIKSLLQPKTEKYYNEFYKCISCGKIYWKGSHYLKMKEKIDRIIN
jgi:uncharacterized protein with PIN domain